MGRWIKKLDEWTEKSRQEFENQFLEDFDLVEIVAKIWDICESFESDFYFTIWCGSGIFASTKQEAIKYCSIINGEIKISEISFEKWQILFKRLDASSETFVLDIVMDCDPEDLFDDEVKEKMSEIKNRINNDFPDMLIKCEETAFDQMLISCTIVNQD